jgi:hypothetical protein
VLNVGEVGWHIVLADVLCTHIRFEPNDRIVNRDGFGHQVDNLTRPSQLGEGVHFDEF